MNFNACRTKLCFLESVTFLALASVLPCYAASAPASTSGCTVRSTNYLGWEAEELANPWVKLEIVTPDWRTAHTGHLRWTRFPVHQPAI